MDDAALAYKLIRMPGSIENVANHAIWRLRGSPTDENVPVFLRCLKLSG